MGIIECAVQRMRRKIAEVFLVEFAKRAYKAFAAAANRSGEFVGLILVLARKNIENRREPKRERARKERIHQ